MIIFTTIFTIIITVSATATLAFQIPVAGRHISIKFPPQNPFPSQPPPLPSSSLSPPPSPSFRVSLSPPLQATEHHDGHDNNEQKQELLLEGECLDDWEIALYECQSSDDEANVVSKDSILRHTFVADLLADGTVDSSEIEDIWTERVGKDVVDGIDVNAFTRFWYAVDDLFAQTEDDPSTPQSPTTTTTTTTDDNTIQEVWLDPLAKSRYYSPSPTTPPPTLGECLRFGEVILLLPNIATPTELTSLLTAGLEATLHDPRPPTTTNRRSRFPARSSLHFPSIDTTLTAESVFLSALDVLDAEVPSIYEELFRPGEGWAGRQPLNARMEQPTVEPEGYLAETCGSLRELYMAGELEFSEGEPAINIYKEGGYFGAHKDHLGLTVLFPLTLPDGGEGEGGFRGGGTGFWSGNRATPENPVGGMASATAVIRPERLGCALVFGGDVTHAGMEVEGGVRGVFVASCSTRTEVSLEDRVRGLQRDDEEF